MITIRNEEGAEIHPAPDLPDIAGRNPLYPVMTDAVTFKYEEGRGRFAVANREITVAAHAIAHSCMLNYLCEGW